MKNIVYFAIIVIIIVVASCTEESKTYSVSTKSSIGGKVEPSSQNVKEGKRATFTVKADKGYFLDSIVGCNGVLNGDKYTTGTINADCEIEARFKAFNQNNVLQLKWPIACIPGNSCNGIGLPDIDNDGKAYNCAAPGYKGHTGTDIGAEYGTPIFAAMDGEVLWAFDGKDDDCPSSSPDCQKPPPGWSEPGGTNGYTTCTELGPYCGDGSGNGQCYWCFTGNVVVIRHKLTDEVFATRYEHFKKNSILVSPGDKIVKGQKIGEAGSSGNSTGPHLHFEVWGKKGFYSAVDPWAGPCGPNRDMPLWENGNIPWER